MLKVAKSRIALTALALPFALPHLGWSMEPEKASQPPRQMVAVNEKNAAKMCLFSQKLKDANTGEVLPALPREIHGIIGGMLYKVTKNSVLKGELIYARPSDRQRFTFKIKDLVKEGTLDLSDKEIFENIADDTVITTDITRFFEVEQKNIDKIAILIAPWFLISENLDSTAKPFKPIMTTWDKNAAPIGIFWRGVSWDNLNCYLYLINQTTDFISKTNFYDLWAQHADCSVRTFFNIGYTTENISFFIFKPKKDLTINTLGTQSQTCKNTEQKTRNGVFELFDGCRQS